MEEIDSNIIDKIEDVENTEYACPYCDRTIEIFNNNLDFSIAVHSQLPIHKRAFRLAQKNSAVAEDEFENLSDRETDSSCKDVEKLSEQNGLNIEELDLTNLFKQIRIKYENSYSIEYISGHQNKIYCTLCMCDIEIPNSIFDLMSNIHLHITGIHFPKIVSHVNSQIKCTDDIKAFLDIIDNKLKCTLCLVTIRVEGMETTLPNVLSHFETNEHKKNLKSENKKLELIKLGKNDVFQSLPENLRINRLYMFMNITGKFYCQLCQTSVNPTNFLSHITTKNHSASILEKCASLSALKNYVKPYLQLNSLFHKTFEVDLPEIIRKNENFIEKAGKSYKCSVCNQVLMDKLNVQIMCYIFKKHFTSIEHHQSMITGSSIDDLPKKMSSNIKAKYRTLREDSIDLDVAYKANMKVLTDKVFENVRSIFFSLKSSEACNTTVTKPTVVLIYEYLRDIFYPYFPMIVIDNIAFIEKKDDFLSCKLCLAELIIGKDILTTIYNFNIHFVLKGHIKQVISKPALNFVKVMNRSLSSTMDALPPMDDSVISLPSYGQVPETDGNAANSLVDLDKISEVIANNKKYLRQDNNFSFFLCIMCKKKIRNTKSACKTFINIYQHFISQQHTESINKKINPVENPKFRKIYLEALNVEEQIPKDCRILGHFTFANKYFLSLSYDAFEQNKIYFGKLSRDIVFCILCEKEFTAICNYADGNSVFSQHFESTMHSYRVTIELLKTDGKLKC